MRQLYFLRFIRSRHLFVLLLPVVISSAAHGQTAPGTTPASETTTVVKNVDEVSVDFVVRNRKKPVLDLKPEDVVVTDDGATVKISGLHLVTSQTGVDHPVTFLFDSLDPSAATNARDAAKKILKLLPANEFSFAVLNINGRLHLLHEFTSNREELQKAISAATREEGSSASETAILAEKNLLSAVQLGEGQAHSPESAYDRGRRQALLASLTESQRIIQDQHTQAPLAGLLALIRTQTRIPGRKLLVYFTEGLQSDADVRDTVRTIVGAANRAQVRIYVIDKTALDTKLMEGLMQSQAMGALSSYMRANPAPTGPAAQQPTTFSGGMISQVNNQITRVEGEGLAGDRSPLTEMAARTGGAYLFSEDSLKKPFKQAVADLTTYYQASYVPPGLVYNGAFHQTSVKSLRRGLKIQSRAGYFAVPPEGGVRPFEVPLLKVLSEPQLPSEVKFRTSVLQLGNLATGNENTLVVEVPTSGLERRTDVNANLTSWHVSVVSQIKDNSGSVVEHFSEDIPGHSALDSKDEAGDCASLQRHFPLLPGHYTLETVVLDRNSGKTGGERSTFEVRGPTTGPFLSDIALVRQIDSSSEELDPFEPLRYQHGKVVPNVSGQVIPGTKELSFFFLVHPDKSIPDPAMLEIQVLRNGELMGQVPLQLPKGLSESFPYIASLRTSSLPVGNYGVRLSMAQGDRVVERGSSFSIGSPELANAAVGTSETLNKDKEVERADDSVIGDAAVTPAKRQPLVITALPAESIARPSDDELERIIAGARKNAVNYSVKLPNFLCVEITDRSVDSSGNGKWRRKDSFGELLRYTDNQETRTTLEVDGRPSKVKRADMNGPISLGEFGHLLSLVFQPSSKAEFHWKETAALANGRVQVFEYRVDRKNDSMVLSDSNEKIYASFHGLVYIDSSTLGIRRITMEAEDLPPNFSIHAASIAVDYEYVSVGGHDYLMPFRGTIRLKRGRHESDLNQVVFQDYRRYASQVKLIVKPME